MLNHEARGRAFSNIAVAVNNARQAGYLAPAGQGRKRITDRGEALVEALPDPERVKEVLNAHPIRRRTSRRRTGKRAR